MATLAHQNVIQTGLLPTYAAASAGGDKAQPGMGVFLHVKNAHTSSWTVTIDSKRPSDYATDVDIAVVVPNASERMIPLQDTGRFAYGTTDGLADISYTGVTALTVALVRVPPTI